jgi:hypothetical protein
MAILAIAAKSQTIQSGSPVAGLACDFPLSHLESASLRTVKKSQLGFNFGNFGIYGNFGNRRQVTDYSIRLQPEAQLTSDFCFLTSSGIGGRAPA